VRPPSIDLIRPEYLDPAIALWFTSSFASDPLDGLELLLTTTDAAERARLIAAGYERAVAAGVERSVEHFAEACMFGLACFHESAGEGIRTGLTSSWYGFGMPTLEVGHKLAANLIVTKPSRELLAETPMPFPVFLLYVPSGLLYAQGSSGIAEMRAVFVGCRSMARTQAEARWCSCVLLDSPQMLWRVHHTLEDLVLSDKVYPSPEMLSVFDKDLDDLDERNQELVHRLVGNLILYVSDPERLKPIGAGHGPRSPSRKRGDPLPTRRVFRVVGDVKHDFRHFVKEYARGTGKKIDLQRFVEGYFKMQHHGPRGSLRKRIHVESYWRGPEDAPIAQRRHVYE
jgi:hypothetical protein